MIKAPNKDVKHGCFICLKELSFLQKQLFHLLMSAAQRSLVSLSQTVSSVQ